MKQIRKQWLIFYQKILGVLLVMLGFSACDGEGFIKVGADMYGMPPVDRFTIKGAVKDEAGNPITSAKVTVRDFSYPKDGLYVEGRGSETYEVNDKGEYIIVKFDYSPELRIVAKDTAHESDSVEVTPVFDSGGLSVETVDFTLKKKNEQD